MPRDGRTVCVVGGEARAREAMERVIRSGGFDVQTFDSAEDFVDREATSEHAGLVLELTGNQKHLDYPLPVIRVTDHEQISATTSELSRRPVEFLESPFRDEDLFHTIERMMIAHSQAPVPREDELASAAQIQRGLMAITAPQPAFAGVAGMNLPCREIGGDFFTTLAVDDYLVIAIADVSGKGIAAAVMASALQGMMHEGLRYKVPLAEIARDANEFFSVRDLGAKYATCVIARIQENGNVEYLNCGHVQPCLVRDGEVMRISETNFPIGLLQGVEYRTACFQLKPGDRIVLVTDGVTDAESPDGEFFGYERLEALAASGMSTEEILAAVHQFCGGNPITDDCTIIGLDYFGNATARE